MDALSRSIRFASSVGNLVHYAPEATLNYATIGLHFVVDHAPRFLFFMTAAVCEIGFILRLMDFQDHLDLAQRGFLFLLVGVAVLNVLSSFNTTRSRNLYRTLEYISAVSNLIFGALIIYFSLSTTPEEAHEGKKNWMENMLQYFTAAQQFYYVAIAEVLVIAFFSLIGEFVGIKPWFWSATMNLNTVLKTRKPHQLRSLYAGMGSAILLGTYPFNLNEATETKLLLIIIGFSCFAQLFVRDGYIGTITYHAITVWCFFAMGLGVFVKFSQVPMPGFLFWMGLAVVILLVERWRIVPPSPL